MVGNGCQPKSRMKFHNLSRNLSDFSMNHSEQKSKQYINWYIFIQNVAPSVSYTITNALHISSLRVNVLKNVCVAHKKELEYIYRSQMNPWAFTCGLWWVPVGGRGRWRLSTIFLRFKNINLILLYLMYTIVHFVYYNDLQVHGLQRK